MTEPVRRTRDRRFMVVWAVAIAALAGCGTDYEPRVSLIEAFEVPEPTSRVLVLHYMGGGCEGGVDHVKVDETLEQLIVTLWLRQQVSGDCDDYGEPATYEVELKRAVGSRKLFDGSCVEALFPEHCPDGRAPTPRPVFP